MGGSTAAGPSVDRNDSSSSRMHPISFKRRLICDDQQEESPSKRKSEGSNGIISDDSSSSDEDEPNTEFAPLESDLDESAPEHQVEHQFIRSETEHPTGSPSGNQSEDENGEEIDDEDETLIPSDPESESLLLPVEICFESQAHSKTTSEHSTQTVSAAYPKIETKTENEGSSPEASPAHSPQASPAHSPQASPAHSPQASPAHSPQASPAHSPQASPAHSPQASPAHSPGQHTNGLPVPQQTSTVPSASPDPVLSVTSSPPCNSSAISPVPCEPICTPPLASPSSPTDTIMDSANFWKRCNAAGCTQAIFTDFINRMKDISSRIQSDEASPEDYDNALAVIATSGILRELVAKQQEELLEKQLELQKALEAMNDVVSVLNM